MTISTYGPCGPLGFPLSEKQARNLDTLLKALPKSKEFEYRKTVFLKAPTELKPGERSDVSWISTETPDRYDHVVFAKGMNDSQPSPPTPLPEGEGSSHRHAQPRLHPPADRPIALAKVRQGRRHPRHQGEDDLSADARQLARRRMLGARQGICPDPGRLGSAKSIGWLPKKAHFADVKEAAKNNWHEGMLIVEEWLLIEYAVGTIPVNPETVVEMVSKTIPGAEPVPFITLEELEMSMQNRIESIDIGCLVQESIARRKGRV